MAAKRSYRLKSKEESKSKEDNIETNPSYPLPAGEKPVGRWMAVSREEGTCQGTAGVCVCVCVPVPLHIWHMDLGHQSKLFGKWVGSKVLSTERR